MAKSRTVFSLLFSFIFMLVVTCNSENDSDEQAMLLELNTVRQSQSLPTVSYDPSLHCLATNYLESADDCMKLSPIFNAENYKGPCNLQDDHDLLVPQTCYCNPDYITPKEIIEALLSNSALKGVMLEATFTVAGAAIVGPRNGGYSYCILFHDVMIPVVISPPAIVPPAPRCDIRTGIGCGQNHVSTGYNLRSCGIKILILVILLVLPF